MKVPYYCSENVRCCLFVTINLPNTFSHTAVAEWLTIATFETGFEARLLQGLLIAHDIEAIVADEEIVNMLPGSVYSVGGVKVRVREQDLERALTVLNAPLE
jgi:hypothetical protein